MDTNKSWYAMYVANGQEEYAKECIETQMGNDLKFKVFKRKLRERKDGKWREVERKLFPGYILVNGEINDVTYYKLKAAYAGCKLIRDSEVLLPIKESELRVLKLLTNKSNGEIGISSLYKVDDQIKVLNGPLMGLEGLIVSVDMRKGRAKVRLKFLGEVRVVELGVEIVEKIGDVG